MGIGIDLVDMRRLAEPDRLADFVLSEAELAEYKKRKKPTEYLAGRFAGKEAFLKALGKGLGDISLKAIEILTGPHGEPILHYLGEYYAISIAHDGDYAVAVVKTER